MIPRPRINLILYHGVLPFDVAQGTPSKVEGWGHGRRGPSTLLRAIPSAIEGWWALPADRADRTGGGDRAHSAPSAAADRGADTAPGAGAVPRRSSGRPERSRRAPLFVARSFDEDTGGSAFDRCLIRPIVAPY